MKDMPSVLRSKEVFDFEKFIAVAASLRFEMLATVHRSEIRNRIAMVQLNTDQFLKGMKATP